MAFPAVDNLVTQAFSSSGSVRTVNIPATINSGDLLLVLLSSHYSDSTVATSSAPAGWTEVFDIGDVDLSASPDGYNNAALYARSSDGTETTVDITNSESSSSAVAIVYTISAWSGTIADVEFNNTSHIEGVTSINPPSLTASWGSDDNLWIAYATAWDDSVTFNGFPSGYSGNVQVGSAAGSNLSCEAASSYLGVTTATEDPGAFTLASSESGFGHTIVVKPGTSGGSGGADHALDATGIESSTETSSPSLTQAHSLAANDIESSSSVTSPALGQVHSLTSTSVESSSSTSSPSIAQVHSLDATDTQSTSELTSPTLSGSTNHNLSAVSVESASNTTTPAIGQAHNLQSAPVSSVTEVGSPSLQQAHVLTSQSVESGSGVNSPALIIFNPDVVIPTTLPTAQIQTVVTFHDSQLDTITLAGSNAMTKLRFPNADITQTG